MVSKKTTMQAHVFHLHVISCKEFFIIIFHFKVALRTSISTHCNESHAHSCKCEKTSRQEQHPNTSYEMHLSHLVSMLQNIAMRQMHMIAHAHFPKLAHVFHLNVMRRILHHYLPFRGCPPNIHFHRLQWIACPLLQMWKYAPTRVTLKYFFIRKCTRLIW